MFDSVENRVARHVGDVAVPEKALHIAFRSGMSRSNDMNGCIRTRTPVGVVAGELGTIHTIMALPKYLRTGGSVFVDSGAFNAVRSGQEPDFNRVLNVYETLVDMTRDDEFEPCEKLENLYVVSPDMVGDQVRTLELIKQYKDRILALIASGCRVIVAIQQGAMPAMQMLNAIKDVLGTDRFVAGIPSCAKPMSLDECATINHHSVHILGRVVKDEEQIARIAALSACNPAVVITADACWLRSRLKAICEGTEATRAERRNDKYDIFLPTPRAAAVAELIQSDTKWTK